MFNIFFYKTENGKEQAKEYIKNLSEKKDKNSRIKLNKILEYIDILANYGTRIGKPYIKHIEGKIWELRPLKDRFFFVVWTDESFVILHQFTKKTQKTPKKEIEQAKREYNDLIARGIE